MVYVESAIYHIQMIRIDFLASQIIENQLGLTLQITSENESDVVHKRIWID